VVALRVEIVRYVDAAFPGLVELQLVDTRGRRWTFHEKVPIVTLEDLDGASRYPRPGTIACELLEHDGQTARVSTARPWDIHSVDGETEFEISVELLVDE
jgi:hypothetical protein